MKSATEEIFVKATYDKKREGLGSQGNKDCCLLKKKSIITEIKKLGIKGKPKIYYKRCCYRRALLYHQSNSS